MNKIKNTLITIVGVIVICFIFSIFIPDLRESFLFFLNTEWLIVKEFFLEDAVKSVVIYIVIALIITCLGFGISAKTEKKIWSVVSLIVDVMGLIVMIGNLK